MRNRMTARIATLAVTIAATLSAAPAMACYGGCSQGFNFGAGYSTGCGVGFGGCGGYGVTYYGHAFREHLTDPSGPRSFVGPQYYYVNQGPYYTGPGSVAPSPTYQERAVNGWYSTSDPYYYGYYGGPYANATNHLYDGAYVAGPAVYSYRWHRRHLRRTGFRGHPYASGFRRAPAVYYGYAGPRTQGERMRIY